MALKLPTLRCASCVPLITGIGGGFQEGKLPVLLEAMARQVAGLTMHREFDSWPRSRAGATSDGFQTKKLSWYILWCRGFHARRRSAEEQWVTPGVRSHSLPHFPQR